MTTKAKVKKKSGYVGEVKGQLLIFTPETIRRVISRIPEREAWGSASVANGRAGIFTPETAPDRANYSQEKEKANFTSKVREQLKIFTPEIISQILRTRRLAARRLAQNIFNNAMKKKQLDRCNSCLRKVASLSQDRVIATFLEDPKVRFQDKAKLLSVELEGTHPLVINLVYRLLTKRKICMLADIADEYSRLFDCHYGVITAHITTAITLDDADKLKIIRCLDKMFGKKVMLLPTVDPSIIGGIVIRVGDKLLDGSIRSKLASLKGALV